MLKKLLQLSKKLRTQCPWDKSRKLEDMPKMLIEESEEIREAIEKKNWKNLKEEIGDVLFNLCLIMTIAEEQGKFTAPEVLNACDKKIRSRHTWVFGKDKASTPEEAFKLWKKNKKNSLTPLEGKKNRKKIK